MENLINKLNIYETFGFLVPGFLVVLVLSIFYTSLGIKTPINIDNSFLFILIIFVISYYIGILMHELSEIIQIKLKKDWKGFPSERILVKEDLSIIKNQKEKQDYYEIAQKDFGINVNPTSHSDSDLVFHRFRSALINQNKYESSNIFNVQYGLYRNFLAVSLSCFTIFYILIVKNALNGVIFIDNIFNCGHMILFCFFSLLLIRRVRRFGEYYVKAVFRGYYELYKEKYKNISS